MKISFIISTAFAAAVASSRAIDGRDDLPELPDGHFVGINNPDGTTTMNFTESGQTFTFKPRAADVPAKNIARRHFGQSQCWGEELDHDGVDYTIARYRDFINSGITVVTHLGKPYTSSYAGFNKNGVYSYFCTNTNDPVYRDTITSDDLDTGTAFMDEDCGAYMSGFFQWDSPTLFGKCKSGTSVCDGSK